MYLHITIWTKNEHISITTQNFDLRAIYILLSGPALYNVLGYLSLYLQPITTNAEWERACILFTCLVQCLRDTVQPKVCQMEMYSSIMC